MSNRFTEKAEKALNNAINIAEAFGHTYIGSEHILLSVLEIKDSSASVILTKNGLTPEKVKTAIKEISGIGTKSSLTPKDMTPRCRRIVEASYKISLRYGGAKIGTEHILLAILEEKDSVGAKIISAVGADSVTVIDELLTLLRNAEKHFEGQHTKKDTSEATLNAYGKNLTREARTKSCDPVIGREKETERLIRILSRKTKNNPCLIGEAGVGKTAIVEGLAQRIAIGDVPRFLRDKSIISVDLTSMVAGAKYRGDFEERIKNMLNEAAKNKNIILFIDEIHTIVGAGSAEGAIDAANILKPQLSRAEIQLIGATTFDEYHKYIKKDAALDRRFQPLTVDEPTHSETVNILRGLRERFEEHHNVVISDSAIEATVTLSERYLQDRFMPDKAIDVMDEACAMVGLNNVSNMGLSAEVQEKIRQIGKDKENAIKNQDYSAVLSLKELEYEYLSGIHKEETSEREAEPERLVGVNEIKTVINEITGIPIVGLSHIFDFKTFSQNIKRKIIGQDEAVDTLIKSVLRSEAGINNPERPKGVFLFVGPSGVGKTELAKALSEELFFDERAIIRYDMSEFSENNSVTKLIGSPPGYIGYEEGGALTEKIRRHPYSVILFDEIEKANEEVLNLFLQIMDDGVISDSCGRRASFKNAYIIMTSNVGKHSDARQLGFLENEAYNDGIKELSAYFRPEFINRIDAIVSFKPLSKESLSEIAEKLLSELKDRLMKICVNIEYGTDLVEYIGKKASYENLGARAVNRIIVNEIESKISELIVNEQSDIIKISVNNGAPEFVYEKHRDIMLIDVP